MTNVFNFRLGDFACTVLREGSSKGSADWIFAHAPADELTGALAAAGIAADNVPLSMNVLLVKAGSELVLVDTGIGAGIRPTAGLLLEHLAEVHVTPDQITTIIITHGDRDHIGGLLTQDGRFIYPNARLFISQEEWDYIMNGGEEQKDKQAILTSLTDRFTRISGETEVLPGFTMLPAPGHKPGHYALLIESAGERLLHIADAAHTTLHFAHPDWSPQVDVDVPTAITTRKSLLERAANDKLLVLAYHMPFPGLGSVAHAGETYQWQAVRQDGA